MTANIDMLNPEMGGPAFKQIPGMHTILPGRITCCMNRPIANMPMQTPVAILLDVTAATTPYCLPPFMRLIAATPPATIGHAAAACTVHADPANRTASGNQLINDSKG